MSIKNCLICRKEFRSESGLKKHIKNKHNMTYVQYKDKNNIVTFPKNRLNEAKIVYDFLSKIINGESVKYTDLKRDDYRLLCQIEKSSFKNVNNLCDLLGFTKEDKKTMNIKTNGETMSDEEIYKRLLSLKEVGKLTTIGVRTQFDDQRLQSAISKKFGHLENCLKYFNLERDLFRWTDEMIYKRIKDYERRGIDLSYVNMIKYDSRTVYTINNRFKIGWYDYLDSIGVKYKRKKRKFSRKTIADLIMNYLNQGFDISPMGIKAIDGSLHLSIYEYFGTFEDLYLYIGLNPEDYISYDNLQALGFMFEKIVKDTFDLLRFEYSYNKPAHNVRPDFQLANNIWADAKLSSWTAFSDQTFDKYLPHCDHLIIIYYRGKKIKNHPSKVSLKHISEYTSKLNREQFKIIENKLTILDNKINKISECS